MKLNKIIGTVLVFAAAVSAVIGIVTAKDSGIKIEMTIGNPVMYVNGASVNIDESGTVPVIVNDRTLLPVRALIENMGGTVSWNDETRTATLSLGNDEIRLTIDSVDAFYNGDPQKLDTAPIIINDRTMLPIRYIAEHFGFQVDWSEEQQTVTVTGTPKETVISDYEVERREISASNNGKNIYGVAYIPQNAGNNLPTVIYSHGYGGTNQSGSTYAKALASKGYVVYCYDFRGGSPSSRSDGSTTEMTVFTEISDLNAVIDMVKELDFVDRDKIYLIGSSQGGLVSATVANNRPDEIAGLMLIYPALCIPDNAHDMYSSKEDIPETISFMGMTVGHDYWASIYDYDVYSNIAGYTKPVLILHGDRDSVVPVSYSKKAAEVYNDAELVIFPGAVHGFGGEYVERAITNMLDYLSKMN